MSSLGEVLEAITDEDFEANSGMSWVLHDRIALELADSLGIDRDFVHTMPNIGEGLRPTALIQVNENKDPWALFEVVPENPIALRERAIQEVRKYLHYAEPELAAVFSPAYVLVLNEAGEVLYEVNSEDHDGLEHLRRNVLSPPEIIRHREDEPDGGGVEHDAFISHASEDKEQFVDPLAQELKSSGLEIWYDDFELEVGDNIRREIERGLSNSRFGIVILSEHFFEKEWPQRELDALAERETDEGKVILPVWYNVDKDFIKEYSLPLANKLALKASQENVGEVAEELYEAVKG